MGHSGRWEKATITVTDTTIALAGKIGSGKSSVASLLAERLGGYQISFSSVVRKLARERDLVEERAVLQMLGDELISQGWDAFCTAVLEQAPGAPVVIDGVRHTGAVSSLRKLIDPARLVVVYIEVPESVRMERLLGRGLTSEQVAAGDRHPNEAELPVVKSSADIIVRNDRALVETVNEVMSRTQPGLTGDPNTAS